MDTNDNPKPLDDLIEPGTTLMVGTSDPDRQWSFRPLTVARVDGSLIDVLVDTTEDWVTRFGATEPVHVTVSDNRSNTWLDLHASATLSRKSELIDELWNPAAAAYFDEGRESPGIGAFRIDVSDGRYWSTPSGRLGSLVSIIKAKLGDAEEDSGQHGDVVTN